MLQFDVITLFPEMFSAVSDFGVSGRARLSGLWRLRCWNPRQFAQNRHGSVDDRPFGGGAGMVMQAPPLARAIACAQSARGACAMHRAPVWYLSPQGLPLDHARVSALAVGEGVVLLCGRYEGVDERLLSRHVDEEISLGDFVLSGGEIAAMAIMDAAVRQLPGALGHPDSARDDSFVDGLLDYPHYTRPEVFEGESVPSVLMNGHHEHIRRWRLQQALGRTWLRRPELLADRKLSSEEMQLLDEFRAQHHHDKSRVPVGAYDCSAARPMAVEP
jgi:tRNA (guanine37-N1)-methyltransferase